MDKIFKLLLSAVLLLCCITLNAQQPTGDGSQANPYQIATSDDLVWFAGQVNSGNTSACAKLTADITVNTGVLDSDGNLDGTPSNIWTPIGGQNGRDYSGEFDGDGHTISGLYFNDESVNNIGLFGKTANNAHIHDLGISDSYFCGKDHVGGICGDFANGQIENCWSEVTVYVATGDGGGLTGSVYINAVLTNCYSICNVSGNGSRGLVCGAFHGTIENCYAQNRNSTGTTSLIGWTSGEGPHTATNVEIKDAAAFASGEVCWLLNNGVTDGTQKWYQTLGGTDNLPVLDNSHGTVYYGYDGNVLTYSNSPLTPLNSAAYIDVNGEPQTADNVTEITNSSSALNAGWYVVRGNDVKTGTLTCSGAVHLILADGAKLTAAGGDSQAGIQVSGEGNSLTIYGQTAQSGQLIATGGEYGAGIGGGKEQSGSNITINGGTVTASGGTLGAGIGGGYEGNGSNITIVGGNVTATSRGASAIGGGNNGNGSDITINGGVVTASGGDGCAGIGGGKEQSGSNITINGGTVTASGGNGGSGIGGGFRGSGSNITINGGTVTASSGGSCAGIGGGYNGSGSNITINGGTVTANGGQNAAGIGGGQNGSGSNITINGGTVTANGGQNAAGIGGGNNGNGSDITINGGVVTASGGDGCAGIGGGYKGSSWNIKVAASLTVYADNTNPPTTEISHADNDIASYIAALRCVIVNNNKTDAKQDAIDAINAAIEGVTDADIIAIATNAINAINAATTLHEIESLKEQALAAIASAKAVYNSALGEMGTPCTDCPAVEVTGQNDNMIKLYNPKSVKFKKE